MKPSVTIITRLRGIEKQSTNVKQQKAKTNFGLYAKKPTTPKNVSPVPKKEKCLLSGTMKYTMFTSNPTSDVLLVTAKPIYGKNINETFKTKDDLIEFTRSILKDTSLLEFDHVYNETSSIDEIYSSTIKTKITNLFHGFNSSIIFFGPKNSGKSYLLRGSGEKGDNSHAGILTKAILDVFNLSSLAKQANKANDTIKNFYKVKMSAFQIYMDNIDDLLCKEQLTNEQRNEIVLEKFYDNGEISCRMRNVCEVDLRNQNDYDLCMKEVMHQRKNLNTLLNVNDLKRKSCFIISIIIDKIAKDFSNNKGDNTGTIISEERYSKINFVELPSSDYGFKAENNGDVSEDANLCRDVIKTFNSLSNAIVSAKAGMTPKNECKLTLALKDTINKRSSVVFINCAIPFEYPLNESFKATKFSNWLRNQVMNIKGNVDYRHSEEDIQPENNIIEEQVPIKEKKERRMKSCDISHNNQSGDMLDMCKKRLSSKHNNLNSMSSIECGSNLNTIPNQEKYSVNASMVNQNKNNPNESPVMNQNNIRTIQSNPQVYQSMNSTIEQIPQRDASPQMNNNIYQSLPSNATKRTSNQLQSIANSLNQLNNRSMSLANNLETLRNENNMNMSNTISQSNTIPIDKLQTEYASLRSDNIIYREDINRLSTINNTLEAELREQRERNIQLTSILEDCKKEKYTVEKTLSELKEKINNGTYIEKSSANPTVLDMLNQKYQMENYKRETSNELNRLREEKSKYEVEYRVNMERNIEMKKNYDRLVNEHENMKKTYADQIGNIEDKIYSLSKELERLQDDNAKLRCSETELKKELYEMKKEKEKYQEKYEEEKNCNEAMQRKMEVIEKDFRNIMIEKDNEMYLKMKEEEIKKVKMDSKTKILSDLQDKINKYKEERNRKKEHI